MTEPIIRVTQREFLRRCHRHFPRTPLLVSIGNNDLWPNSKNDLANFQAIYDVLRSGRLSSDCLQRPLAHQLSASSGYEC